MTKIVCPTRCGALALLFAAGVGVATASEPSAAVSVSTPALDSKVAQPPPPPPRSRNWHARNSLYYQRKWGVDITGVKPIASGYMLEFRYRITDADAARILNEKKAVAYLVDQKSGTTLAVPAMENIGELRQTSPPQNGRSYYILFGNPGRLVRAGDRVSIVVGDFRADDLIVD